MNRFEMNPARIPDARLRKAKEIAQKRLEGGCLCDDCLELHNDHRAVAFIIVAAPPGSEVDYFAAFLCKLHADFFLMKQDKAGVYLNGKKVAN